MRQLALVRRPSPRLAEGIVTHADAATVDPQRALRQWIDYVRILQSHGWAVVEAPPAPECPDGVFIEDPVLVYGGLAILTRSGAPARRGEQVGLEETMRSLGYRVERIAAPGTLDGGDVLKHDRRVWVAHAGGHSRTDDAGYAQLQSLLDGEGVTCHRVPIEGVLHLKSAVTMLPDGTAIGWEPALPDRSTFPRFLAAPEPEGAHVVLLGARTVLMAASAPDTSKLLQARGLDVVRVDISEFEHLDGCVTCLSVRLRG